MFFSLLQTLICVLLVNSGLYALHLTGTNTPGSGSGSGSNSNSGQTHAAVAASQLNKPATNPFQTTDQRLNEELADLAQLERERLMVLGLVKQTAESESGYHGRPIITGRIKMHPTEEMDSEYANWLNQQSRNMMFGNVVKQPHNEEEDYDTGGGGAADAVMSNVFDPLRSQHAKYDYGRIVQPQDREREREFDNLHNIDLDDFMELESVPDEEDIFPDMDGYAYIEELMTEENKERLQHHHQTPQNLQMLQFPGLRQQQQIQQHHQKQLQQQQHHLPQSYSYQNDENLETNKQILQDFFEREQKLQNSLNHHQQQQQQQQQQQPINQFNPKYRNNIRMQQKWLRKRNQLQQQQQQLPRNIFGQKNAKHHFNTYASNKLALANSEATATTRINNKNKQTETAQQIKNVEQQQQQQQQQQNDLQLNNKDDKDNKQKTSSNLDKSLKIATQQKPELLQQPNHKRSSLTRTTTMENGDTTATVHSPQMLRKVRGQRQYDVPQIECPTAMDGMERFACPTPDLQGRYRCIDDHVLCDGFIDCPEGEDEDRRSCMFYKTTKAHLDVLADALLRWARGR